MADGQILIDSRIQTDGAQKDTQDLKKTLESLADAASASAKNIEKSFDSLSIDDAAEGLGDSFKKEAREIEPIPEKIEDGFDDMDLEDSAEGLADSFEDAWDDVKRETTSGANRVENEIEDIGEEAESAGQKIRRGLGDSLEDAFSGLSGKLGDGFVGGLLGGITSALAEGAIDLLGKTGKALVELGKEAVVAAADVQAANAQFSQAFRGIEDSARSTLEGIAAETGIISTRMQGAFTQIYAFLRTLGADTTTAMDISSRAMRVAADQAAYYDKSIEEVTESLQSFLKGNYENDAALGIAATETTRNAKANEKYAKSFQKLSESQKADVLLSMVEAGNEASGAIGQAAREADTWANVTGNLSEAWKQFLAAIGTPILSAITPIIQGITDTLQFMTEGLSELQLGTGFVDMLAFGFQNLGSSMGIVGPTAEQLTWTLQSMGFIAEETSADVAQLSEQEMAMVAATEATAASVDQLRQEYDSAREAARSSLDSQIGLLTELATKSDKSAKDIIANWEKQKEALTRYTENMQRAVDMGLDEALVQQLSDGSEQSMVILDELVNSTDVDVQAINDAFRGVEDAKEITSSAMADIQTDMSGRLSEIAGNVSDEWGTMAYTVGASISEMQNYINSLQGKDVYVNVITRSITSGGGGSFREQAVGGIAPRTASFTDTQIPYLASGAVIPPNAPFMAMLGDQRNGTNLEAPEGLIRDIFREELADVLGGNMAGFESVVAELQATRAAIEDIQIGDTTIGRAAARYDRRQNLIRGGSTG